MHASYDVIVIGAGPAGEVCQRVLVHRGRARLQAALAAYGRAA